jgi:hypothetical protein
MSQQESQEDAAGRAPLAKGWAMATSVGLFAIVTTVVFFFAQSRLYETQYDAQQKISRQQHCVAVREACHNRERAPALCALRRRLGLDDRVLGPPLDAEAAHRARARDDLAWLGRMVGAPSQPLPGETPEPEGFNCISEGQNLPALQVTRGLCDLLDTVPVSNCLEGGSP